MMKKIIILGTYAFAEEVSDLIDECADLQLTAFCENLNRERCELTIDNKPIIWIDELPSFRDTHEALCAIGTTKRRAYVEQVENDGFRFATLIHPTSRISPRAEIGHGTIISTGVHIATKTVIGKHVILNRGVLVGHHTQIGDYVTISPGANIAGRVTIEDNVYVGMGAILLNDIQVGHNAAIAAGAVVTKNVPPRVKVMGIPAKIVDEDFDGM
jgi:sugar O-acyltransferase (sialic acid O-acetyltransferase NeuD family)